MTLHCGDYISPESTILSASHSYAIIGDSRTGELPYKASSESLVIQGFNLLLTPLGQPLITSSAVDTALLHAIQSNWMSSTLHPIRFYSLPPCQLLDLWQEMMSKLHPTLPCRCSLTRLANLHVQTLLWTRPYIWHQLHPCPRLGQTFLQSMTRLKK